MATQTTGGGSTTSFTNTPQANGDNYSFQEDTLRSNSTLYNIGSKTVFLDVMANDLGGNAKSLFSIDDGQGALNELLQSNVITGWEQTVDGNWIRINAGKIEFKIGDGSGDINNARDVNSLAAGEMVDDTFLYAIRMANGTLAYASVHITITGSNDAAVIAEVAGADHAVVEAGGVNNGTPGDPSAGGTLTVSDVDAGEGHFEAALPAALVGTYGNFTFNEATGAWTYTLDNTLAATQGLNAGDPASDSLTVYSHDGTSYVVTVNITGSNDGPVANADSGSADENETKNFNVIGNDTDVDSGAVLSLASIGAVTVDGNPASAAEEATISMDGDEIKFTPGTAFDHLADGDSVDVVVSYTVEDEHGATSSSTLTITVTGSNDGPVANTDDGGSVGENETKSFDVVANDTDVDDGAVLSLFSIDGVTVDGNVASVDEAGALSMVGGEVKFTPGTAFDHLASGDSATVVVSYTVHDEHGAASSSTLTFTVTGSNDAAVIVEEAGADHDVVEAGGVNNGTPGDPDASGQLAVTDVDDGEDHFEAAAAPDLVGTYGNFTFDETTGAWTYTLDNTLAATQGLNDGEPASDTLTVYSHDGTSHDIVVNITGSNDAAVVTGDDAKSITEDAVPNTVSGNLDSTDVDSGDADDSWQADTIGGDYGSLTINADGTWTYTLDNSNPTVDALNNSSSPLTDTITVKTGDGTEHDVVITINGHTDATDVLAPTDIKFSLASTVGGLTGGTLVANSTLGSFTAVDGDSSSWTFALSGTNAGLFSLSPTSGGSVNLVVNGADVPTGNYSINVTATDGGGNSYLETFTVSVGSVNADGSAAFTVSNNSDVSFGLNGSDTINGGNGEDALVGGQNNDTLNGGLGNDQLFGGQGSDNFVFNTAISPSANVDQILDFDGAGGQADHIQLDDAIFAGIANSGGSLAGTDFVANVGGDATTATQNILYDTATGNLYYDADGNGGGAKVLIATITVTNGTVDASDFIVI